MNKKIFAIPMLVLAALMSFTACSDDDKPTGEPYLTFDDVSSAVYVSVDGLEQSNRKNVVIRSNRPWTVVYANNQDSTWLHTFVDEGVDDGFIQYWADSNPNFSTREAKINFVYDGTVLNTLDIVQEANSPKVEIANAETGYSVLPQAGTLDITVNYNTPFTASLSSEEWAKIESVDGGTVHISYQRNTGDTRSVTLTVNGTGEHSNLTSSTVITQAAPGIVLNESFTWLNEGKEAAFDKYPEVAYSKWTADEKAQGWYSISSWLYGGRGYIKLGKTNYAGDAVSPAFTELKEATDVNVSFKAIGYIASNGKHDDGVLKVALMGPGQIVGANSTIEVNGTTYNCMRFELESFPEVGKLRSEYDPFEQEGAKYDFQIKGATAETRLIFVGGEVWNDALKTVGQKKNRCMIDDVKVQKDE